MGFPRSDLDDSRKLLSLLGSFWLNTYHGSHLVEGALHSRAQLDSQTHRDLLELRASTSRLKVPVWHHDDWYYLTLLESQRNQTPYNLLRHDGSFDYQAPTDKVYGGHRELPSYAWPAPANLVEARLICNRLTEASLCLVAGLDFHLAEGAIVFRNDPFTSELVSPRELFKGNSVVDREVGLWLYRGAFDRQTVQQQFGYVLDYTPTTSSESYRQNVNAIYDALVEGTTVRSLQEFLVTLAGAPTVENDGERVEYIVNDARYRWVITDQRAYAFHLRANVTVSVGQVLHAGDTLTDVVSFHEPGRGQVPEWLGSLHVDTSLLPEGYQRGLIFSDEEVPLVVEEAVDDHTMVSFALEGFPGDVEKFWDDVHATGISQGQTLAHLLDQRPDPQGEPTALALPATVNPLKFLLANVLRNNTLLVRLRTSAFGEDALGLAAGRLLRKIVPPQTLCLIVLELSGAEEPVILDGPGGPAQFGYVERGSTSVVLAGTEEIDLALTGERGRLFPLGGRCV